MVSSGGGLREWGVAVGLCCRLQSNPRHQYTSTLIHLHSSKTRTASTVVSFLPVFLLFSKIISLFSVLFDDKTVG